MKPRWQLPRIGTNAATDPAVLFNAGHAIFGFASNLLSGVAYLGVMAVCAGVRAVSERLNTGASLKMPKFIERLARNPGAAMITAGVLQLPAVFTAAAKGSPDNLKSYSPALMLGCFTAANMALGSSLNKAPGSASYHWRQGLGNALMSGGLLLATPAAPLPVTAAFMSAGMLGVCLNLCRQPARGLLQPNLLFMAGCTGAALTSGGVSAIVNAFYTAGYISLAALSQQGGVYQLAQKLCRRKTAAPD